MAVEYISYKEDKLPIRISYSVLKHLKAELGKDISELSLGEDLKYLEVILWYGLLSGHEAISKELTITREKVEYILDESLEEFNTILTNSFAPKSEEPADPDKKK